MNIKFFSLLAILLIPIQCLAFEGWEHQRLGDLSYHIAKKVFCEAKSDHPFCSKDLETALKHGFFDPLTDTMPKEELSDKHQQTKYISYGKIIMCADYFLSLEKLLAGGESNLIQTHTENTEKTSKTAPIHGNLYKRTKGALLPQKSADLDFPVDKLCNTSLFNFSGARAGHVNHTHFQAEVLTGQKINHLLAISFSAIENSMFVALATNAYSDHFLHDSFAPGHMIAWRSRMTDTAANAVHDYHNQKGITVNIDGNDLKKFAGEKIISTISKEIQDSSNKNGPHRLFFQHEENDCFGECSNNDTSNRARIIEDFKKSLIAGNTTPVHFKGDFRLWNVKQDMQRFVLLILQVRSILDILESSPASQNLGKGIVNSFKDNEWKWQFTGEPKEDKPGGLFKEIPPSNIEAKIGPVKYMIENRPEKYTSEYPEKQTVFYGSRDNIWGISAGTDFMTFGEPQNRKIFNFETLVGADIHPDSKRNNFALTLGAQYYAGTDSNGWGFTSRGIWIFPQTETAISLQVRALSIQIPNRRMVVRPSLGLRIDLGFTSFLTNYLQVSWDHAVQKDGRIRRGMSIGGGIQLVAPTCRIPLIKGIDACQ